jgi:GDP-mannose 6-dehydrogenase
MKVAIFGIGYVGAVSAACLARDGHEVVAVDPNPIKVEALSAGASPIVEAGLPELIEAAVKHGRLRATAEAAEALAEAELSLVCVGTPSRPNGSLDTSFVGRVAGDIGAFLKTADHHHSVVVRSTILPGTMQSLVIPELARASGKVAGLDFGVGYYPEFLREGTAIRDYDDPGAIVFGAADDVTLQRLMSMYSQLPLQPAVVDIPTAEAVKYVNNAWHATKISFANEIGNIVQQAEVDSHLVMEILCADRRLNISPAYLRPGFAFGGSCLPKDLAALRYKARQLDVGAPLLDAVLLANDAQLEKAFRLVERAGNRRVGMVGLSFKADTDDLRDSPLVHLAERLIGTGHELKIYDPNIRLSRLTGSNLAYMRQRLPHLAATLMEEMDPVLEHGETIVLGNPRHAAVAAARAKERQRAIVDLVRYERTARSEGRYQGICW